MVRASRRRDFIHLSTRAPAADRPPARARARAAQPDRPATGRPYTLDARPPARQRRAVASLVGLSASDSIKSVDIAVIARQI